MFNFECLGPRPALCFSHEIRTQLMRLSITVMPILAVTALWGFSGTPAGAQDKAVAATASPTMCLTRQVRGGKDDGKSLAISVSADKADEFRKRGFESVDCSASSPAETATKQAFCDIAQARNRGIDLYFSQHFGFTPKEGCKAFNAVSVR